MTILHFEMLNIIPKYFISNHLLNIVCIHSSLLHTRSHHICHRLQSQLQLQLQLLVELQLQYQLKLKLLFNDITGLEDNDVIEAMSGASALSLPSLVFVPGTICGLGGPDPEALGVCGSCPILSYLILSYLILSYLILSYLISSYLTDIIHSQRVCVCIVACLFLCMYVCMNVCVYTCWRHNVYVFTCLQSTYLCVLV